MIENQLLVPFIQQSRALCGQLDKAADWCKANGVDEGDFLESRLADDMFPLAMQLNFVVAQMLQPLRRLTGLELADPAPAASATLAAQRERLRAAIAIVEDARDPAVAADLSPMVALELPNGMAFDLSGADYVRDWAIPQFYFHIMAAYAIMRMRGVPLGKADFVPHMGRHARRPKS